MARRPLLGQGSLSPFGGGGSSFGVFDIAASVGEQAYLLFRRKEIEWEQGKLTNAEYLTALDGYANALPEGSERLNAQTRYIETKYRVERNTLVAAIDDGKKEWSDLLDFDTQRLNAIQIQDSSAYDEQLGRVREVQQRIFSEAEDVQREKYDDGKITAAQLTRWYQGQLGGASSADNPDLDEAITKRLDDLGDAVLSERDGKMVNDFNAGKVGYNAFVAYANAARGRYAKGTAQYDDWTERITDTREQALEQSLTYRYGLSQRYQQLQKFIQDAGPAPKGSTSTSTSKGKKGKAQVIWTGTGWRTIRSGATGPSTKTSYNPPSASEVAAWKEMQIEVASAKRQMAEISAQIGRQPGGWVSTNDMVRYYGKVQGKYAKGSPEWYNVQERLDSLNQQKHAEAVLARQGVRISYPKVKSERSEGGNLPPGGDGGSSSPSSSPAFSAPAKSGSTKSSGGGGGGGASHGDREVGLDEFMTAIARVESGGRYDAVNKSSGARGKYQIMPANWAGWAGKYLGDGNADWTPGNQEKVARGKMQDLYRWLKDWRAVAHWWLTGGSDAKGHRNPATWSSSSKSYVNKVFAGMGMAPTQVSGNWSNPRPGASPSGAGPGPAGGGRSAGGTSPSTGGAAAAPPAAGGKGKVEQRTAFDIPKGLDGRQFERFYSRFLDAYEMGEENFVDYSSGRAINYFIPGDLDDRSETIGYLDEVRISYFAERARAYAGTASEEVAMTQYSDAIKRAGENQMLILATHHKVKLTEVPSGAKMNLRQPASTPAGAAKAINPIAEGLRLKEHTEKALAQHAAQAKAAFARGDDEMAYALIQRGLDLAAKNEAILQTYYANASANIRQLRGTGADIPDMVKTDMAELGEGLDFDASDGKASPGYAKALADLDETAAEIEKFVAFDPATDEPVRRRGATDDDDRFQYNPGVDLFLKPNGEVEHRQTTFTGWIDANTPSRDKDQYVTVSVKIGASVKQVKAAWQAVTIGFIEGSNIPIQGKLITGQMDGREYAWVENPFAPGKWIRTTPGNALVIKAPPGMAPYRSESGATSLQFSGGGGGGGPKGGGGGTYRLEFNDEDGTYHVFEAPGMFDSDWKDLGSASSSQDLMGLFRDSGWKVDDTKFSGDDAYFFNATGAWIGFDKRDHEAAVKNTQSPQTGAPKRTNGPGFFKGADAGPAFRAPDASPTFSRSPDERGADRRDETYRPVALPKAYEDGKASRFGPSKNVDRPDGLPPIRKTAPAPFVSKEERDAAKPAPAKKRASKSAPIKRATVAASKARRVAPPPKLTPVTQPAPNSRFGPRAI